MQQYSENSLLHAECRKNKHRSVGRNDRDLPSNSNRYASLWIAFEPAELATLKEIAFCRDDAWPCKSHGWIMTLMAPPILLEKTSSAFSNSVKGKV